MASLDHGILTSSLDHGILTSTLPPASSTNNSSTQTSPPSLTFSTVTCAELVPLLTSLQVEREVSHLNIPQPLLETSLHAKHNVVLYELLKSLVGEPVQDDIIENTGSDWKMGTLVKSLNFSCTPIASPAYNSTLDKNLKNVLLSDIKISHDTSDRKCAEIRKICSMKHSKISKDYEKKPEKSGQEEGFTRPPNISSSDSDKLYPTSSSSLEFPAATHVIKDQDSSDSSSSLLSAGKEKSRRDEFLKLKNEDSSSSSLLSADKENSRSSEDSNFRKPEISHSKVSRTAKTNQHSPLSRSPFQLKVDASLRFEVTDSDSSISPRAEHAQYQISPRAKHAQYQISPRAEHEQYHISPRAEHEQYHISPRAEHEQYHISPRAEHEQYHISPRAEHEQYHISPRAEHEQYHISPRAEHEQYHISPRAEHEQYHISPRAEHEQYHISPRAEHEQYHISPRAERRGGLTSTLSPFFSDRRDTSSGSDYPSCASSFISEVNTEDMFSSLNSSENSWPTDGPSSFQTIPNHSNTSDVSSENDQLSPARPNAPSPDLLGSLPDNCHVIVQELSSLSSGCSTLVAGSSVSHNSVVFQNSVVSQNSIASMSFNSSELSSFTNYPMVCN